jgi:hypothetical protein
MGAAPRTRTEPTQAPIGDSSQAKASTMAATSPPLSLASLLKESTARPSQLSAASADPVYHAPDH